jgi:hypothetical protein
MPRYRIIIHGRNFCLNLEGKWEKFGFCTPRFADAPDPLLAEHTALEDFRQSPKYRELSERTLNSDNDAPVLCGEDIEEVRPGFGAGQKPAGLAFYRESGDQAVEPGATPNGAPETSVGNSDATKGPSSVS